MADEIRNAGHLAWRKYVSDGIPSSGENEPDKTGDIFKFVDTVQDQVDASFAASDSAMAISEATAAELRGEMDDLSGEIEGAAVGLRSAETWTALSGTPGTAALQPGRVALSDAGTHTDPVVGGTVANSGEYRWSVSPAGWKRIGNVLDPAGLAPINSPALTGTPTAPTPDARDSSDRVATTAALASVGVDVPLVGDRAYHFPSVSGEVLAAILNDGRVVSYRRRGKKLVCFGDSITAFSNYPFRIKDRLGFKDAVNVGFGGERMGQHSDANHDKFSMYQLAAAIQANDFSAQTAAAAALLGYPEPVDHTAALARLTAINWNDVSTVTIAYGTNDFGGSLPIGTSADTTGATFRGAIKLAIEKLLTAYPHLELVMVTPMWRQRQASGDNKDATNFPNSSGDFLIEYVDAELDQAALYQIPALDNYRNCGINLQTYAVYLDDGLHARTEPGNELLAKRISAFLETISH